MYKEGIVSKQDYDNSNTHYTVAQANHKAAAEKSKAMQSALESHQAKAEAVQAEIKRLEAEVAQAKLRPFIYKNIRPSGRYGVCKKCRKRQLPPSRAAS